MKYNYLHKKCKVTASSVTVRNKTGGTDMFTAVTVVLLDCLLLSVMFSVQHWNCYLNDVSIMTNNRDIKYFLIWWPSS